MKLVIWGEVDEFCVTVNIFLQARSRESEIRQRWPLARSIGSDRVNENEWRFLCYESLGSSPGRNRAEIFDFVPRARSRDTGLKQAIWPSSITEPEFLISSQGLRACDTEVRVFGQISKMYSTEAGDDRQSITGLIFMVHMA